MCIIVDLLHIQISSYNPQAPSSFDEIQKNRNISEFGDYKLYTIHNKRNIKGANVIKVALCLCVNQGQNLTAFCHATAGVSTN